MEIETLTFTWSWFYYGVAYIDLQYTLKVDFMYHVILLNTYITRINLNIRKTYTFLSGTCCVSV